MSHDLPLLQLTLTPEETLILLNYISLAGLYYNSLQPESVMNKSILEEMDRRIKQHFTLEDDTVMIELVSKQLVPFLLHHGYHHDNIP